MPASLSQAPVLVVGVKRESDMLATDLKRLPEGLENEDIIMISDTEKKEEEQETLGIDVAPHLEDSAQHMPTEINPRFIGNPESTTRYFKDSIDTGLAQLENQLIRWEVARSIINCPLEYQHKVINSALPSDPRHLNLNSILPAYEAEYAYDTQLSSVIDQMEADMKSDPNASPNDTPIQKLIRSGMVRFAIDLSMCDTFLKSKMTNARLATPNEFLRTYGSDCWIQVRMCQSLLFHIQFTGRRFGVGNQIWQFLHRPIVLYHRVYRSALVKDEFVWFFTSPLGLPRQMHVIDMIEKQMPLDLNRNMKISKFNSRLQLGLSTTTPSIVFTPQQIRRVPDICTNSLRISKELMSEIATKLGLSYVPSAISGAHKVSEANYLGQTYTWALLDPVGLPNEILLEVWKNERMDDSPATQFLEFQFSVPIYVQSFRRWKDVQCDIVIPRMRIEIKRDKPDKEVLMTDGAAAIGWGAALGIKTALRLRHLPAAYQARILKSKGLWYLSRDLDKDGFWIEIRASQWKGDVRCAPNDQISFNICNFSTQAKAGHVNRQSIPVIASRNVPASVFIDLQREAFKTVLDPLTTLDPMRLAQTMESHGNLVGVKAKRLMTAATSCVRKELDDFGAAWEKYSNRPYNEMEEIVELLKCGFSTRNNRVLERLNIAGKLICEKMMNFKIQVGCSATVYVIPDPTGTLKEGEVFLRLSQFKDPKTLLPINILKGDCVVARSPCVLPTDVRKVNAVANSRLMCYEDVLVCSIQGQKSLLDYLSGGDYDGDVVIVIWDDAFTKNFINADDSKDVPPMEEYNKYFSDTVALAASGRGASLPTMRVEDFRKLKLLNGTYEREFRRAQLVSIFQPVAFGRYSRMYKVCEYLFGISHPLTMKFGYVYTKCLDAEKQGVVLKTEADQAMKQEFDEALGDLARNEIPLPPWTEMIDISKEEGSAEWRFGRKELVKYWLPRKPEHLLEAIASTSHEEKEKFLKTLELLHSESNDPHLSRPWFVFQKQVSSSVRHAHTLMRFIESNALECYNQYRQALYKGREGSDYISYEAAGRTFWIDGQFDNAIEAVKHDHYSLHFLRGKGKIEYNVLRASALAALAPEKDFFPFYVAFNELCHLRATASELTYQAQSGVFKIGHCPRAFAPEFCQAMMTKNSLLPLLEAAL